MGMRIEWRHWRSPRAAGATGWTSPAWPARQAGRWGTSRRSSLAGGVDGAGCRPARVKRLTYRGLIRLCHASVSGMELRDVGLVMLGGSRC